MSAGVVARGLGAAPSRALSLILAAPLSLIVLLHPLALVGADGRYSHGLLALAMWGISAGFVHGVGFDPRAPAWRWLLSPLLAWVLMGLGYALVWANLRPGL
ncbi:cyd operon YbgE family protein [Pseudomonas sp. RIT-PI-S]|uniref:cyd operon YbgE family protein n=1 Tax=Pseudomonas sp. RIT-PI-S TaxID=3035295 RepID=UPI0021D8FEC7|nr:cyd operon YbgE family protein [Pseudomonas sp. RIT-PI-S]